MKKKMSNDSMQISGLVSYSSYLQVNENTKASVRVSESKTDIKIIYRWRLDVKSGIRISIGLNNIYSIDQSTSINLCIYFGLINTIQLTFSFTLA